MFFYGSFLSDVFSLTVLVVTISITYWKWKYQFWSKHNVPFLEPRVPFGNLGSSLRGRQHLAVSLRKIYNEIKTKGWRYGGIYLFTKPIFVPVDLDLIRNILTKDFEYFHDRDVFYNEKQPLQAHLLHQVGLSWKNLRAKLTPTFSSGKIKAMFNIMVESQMDLQKRMDRECQKNEAINVKEILACFATNIIGSCAFGLDFKALEDEDSKFRQMGRIIFTPWKVTRFKHIFAVTFPKLAKFLEIEMLRKDVADFVTGMVQETIDYRVRNNYFRNDFMQSLIDLKNNAPYHSDDHDGKPLTLDEVASQALVFFAAGFETSSALMSFALYELARREDIQNVLRNEIKSVLAKYDNKISYDALQEMTYLTQVLDETARMHPAGGFLNRRCVKDYKIPNSDVVIKKGTAVNISLLGIHYDEDFYPDPANFDPDRFNEKNRMSRVALMHMPFGEGPRNCIEMRFGLLQSKMGSVALLQNYIFTINERTKEPIMYHPGSIILIIKDGIWLNVQKI